MKKTIQRKFERGHLKALFDSSKNPEFVAGAQAVAAGVFVTVAAGTILAALGVASPGVALGGGAAAAYNVYRGARREQAERRNSGPSSTSGM